MPEETAVAEVETPVTPTAPAADKNEIYSRLAAAQNRKVEARFEPVASE